MKQTLKQISEARGISRFTLSKAAERGAFPATLVPQKVGSYYEVDPTTPEFVQWETGRETRKRPNAGRKKKTHPQTP